MSSFALGNAPLTMTVNLNQGADFIATIRTASGDPWPDGTVVTLVFNDADTTTWTATVAADVLTFDEDKAVVAPLYDAQPKKVQLFYTAGTDDELWASGRVTRHA